MSSLFWMLRSQILILKILGSFLGFKKTKNIDLKVSYRHFLNGTTSCSLQRKKKKAPEKRQKSWKDLKSKVSLEAEEDLDLDANKDPDNKRCLKWRAPKDIIDIYKLYGLNDAFRMALHAEPTPKILPLILELDAPMVDLMKERELKRPW
ncbi:hypothetical protein EZV62_013468 [Acer yangbiense]|uniref:Uncharacterized protein n=1 Tax=Acer yangbiense TaxID=1000413 RepID=A0A5C7HYZ1_9ROSI|nr:hypothetical protein EZV62_013468 [Acer yangbiense]